VKRPDFFVKTNAEGADLSMRAGKKGSPTLARRNRRISTVGFPSGRGFQAEPGVIGEGHTKDRRKSTRSEKLAILRAGSFAWRWLTA